ncbi:MAG TPA: hypothetical protein VGB84_08725, partial [Arachidicoccus sp.]
MKKLLVLALLFASSASINAQDLSSIESNKVRLPNGWSLTPIGKSLPLGDLPLNIAVSKSHRYAAVTNNGQSTQTIQLLDAKNDQELDKVVIAKSWGGLAFSADEKYLYASGGDDNWIIRYAIENNKLIANDTFRLATEEKKKRKKASISPTGITLDDKRHLLYVVTKQNNSLYVFDLNTHSIIKTVTLSAEAYTCLLSADKTELYISIWGGDKVV